MSYRLVIESSRMYMKYEDPRRRWFPAHHQVCCVENKRLNELVFVGEVADWFRQHGEDNTIHYDSNKWQDDPFYAEFSSKEVAVLFKLTFF